MVSINFVFWMYVFFFGLVGAMRGWAKELLVSFSVILSIFTIRVIDRWMPFITDYLHADGNEVARFWERTLIVVILAFFGYQTPKFAAKLIGQRLIRENLQDFLLGLFLGAINGYLIIGSLWYYLEEAKYPFEFITDPKLYPNIAASVEQLINILPPNLLGEPTVYFAMVIAFAFVVIVFV